MSRFAQAALLARNRVAPAGLLLDSISATPAVSLSLRKLRAAYSGSAALMRRSSDNTTLNRGFSGNDFDSAGLLTWAGSGDAYVDRWYNQHASPTEGQWYASSATNVPVVSAGSLLTLGGKPAIQASGASGSFTNYDSSGIAFTTFTANAVLKKASSANDNHIFSSYNSNNQLIRINAGNVPETYFSTGGPASTTAVDISSAQAILTVTRDASGNVDVYLNGGTALRLTGTSTTSGTMNRLLQLFNISVPSILVQEMLFFTSVLSSTDRAAMIANQRAYYGI